jgi:hypothetical protein
MENLFDKLKDALEQESFTDDIKELFAQSMYYYCSATDPSPIIAFKASIPLYVYVDSFVYLNMGFWEALENLYGKLEKNGFSTIKAGRVALRGADITRLILLKDDEDKEFFLFFIRAEANDTFERLYTFTEFNKYIDDFEYNTIVPRYLSNHRYEMTISGELSGVHDKAEYIFGHCNNPKYEKIGEYEYFGDYNDGTKVELYKKR